MHQVTRMTSFWFSLIPQTPFLYNPLDADTLSGSVAGRFMGGAPAVEEAAGRFKAFTFGSPFAFVESPVGLGMPFAFAFPFDFAFGLEDGSRTSFASGLLSPPPLPRPFPLPLEVLGLDFSGSGIGGSGAGTRALSSSDKASTASKGIALQHKVNRRYHRLPMLDLICRDAIYI